MRANKQRPIGYRLCEVCGRLFAANLSYGPTEWARVRACGRKCSAVLTGRARRGKALPPRPSQARPAEVRFWERVHKTESCWLWIGVLRNGYGRIAIKSGDRWRRVDAHRFVFELLGQTVPSDMQVDHLCRVAHCVNPMHLEVVTSAENSRRAVRVRLAHHAAAARVFA